MITHHRAIVALSSGLLLLGSIPLACAESDSSPGSEDDSGVDSSIQDANANTKDADTEADAVATCSPSKLCTTAIPVDARVNLTSVWGSGASDVWAVGTSGTILHYSGTAWERADLSAQDASSTFTLQSIWLRRADDVWILDGNSIRHSTGWRGPLATEWSFFGSAVTSEPIPTAVRGAGDTVWLARGGRPDIFAPTLTKFEGWSDGAVAPENFGSVPGPALTALAASGPNEVWAVGDGAFRANRVEGDGEGGAPAWQLEEHDSRSTTLLRGVWGDDDGVWLVGEGGVLRHMAASAKPTKTFDIVPSPVVTDLYGVFGFGPNDIWAVGEASTVLHWDGSRWARLSTPFDTAKNKPRLLSVWGSSRSDVWIAGNGTMLHYSESTP